MPIPPAPDPERKRSNIAVLLIITAAMLGGWCVMWAAGIFKQMGGMVGVAILVADLVVLAFLWSVLFRRNSGPRS